MATLKVGRKGRDLLLDRVWVQHLDLVVSPLHRPVEFGAERNDPGNEVGAFLCQLHGDVSSHGVAKHPSCGPGVGIEVGFNLINEQVDRPWRFNVFLTSVPVELKHGHRCRKLLEHRKLMSASKSTVQDQDLIHATLPRQPVL